MAYPVLPNNRLIVNGIDLTQEYGLVLADGYVLSPPSPKTYTVDIPGCNGVLDLTESLLGDTSYQQRSQDFTFYAINVDNFETLKTTISNLLHGKSFYYQITMDPDYTYHGRFTVNAYSHMVYSIGKVGQINIHIDADPYKYKPDQIVRIPAIGGNLCFIPSGRKRVRPVIETSGYTRIIFKGKTYEIYQGSWALNDILFTNGDNRIYFNTYDVRKLTWDNIREDAVTWGNFREQRLYEWYKSKGDHNLVIKIWQYIEDNTWESVSDTIWADHQFEEESTEHIEDVYVKYEWGDL